MAKKPPDTAAWREVAKEIDRLVLKCREGTGEIIQAHDHFFGHG